MGVEFLLQGKEVYTKKGTFYQIERALGEISTTDGVHNYIQKNLKYINPEKIEQNFPQLRGIQPKDLLFIDIETCGLAYSHPTFLITLGKFQPSSAQNVSFTSLLARDYGEERSILEYFLQELHASKGYVTFNGKRFDLPRINRRAQSQGVMVNGYRNRNINEVLGESHIDLRDHYDKDLQGIERFHFEYIRKDDLPGSLIPKVYEDYVNRQGDQEKVEKKLSSAVDHNIKDTRTNVAAFMLKVLASPKRTI